MARGLAAGLSREHPLTEVRPLPFFIHFGTDTMTVAEILKAATRIGLDMAKLAHDLAHADIKSFSVADRAAIMRLQRSAHDSALAFQSALPR